MRRGRRLDARRAPAELEPTPPAEAELEELAAAHEPEAAEEEAEAPLEELPRKRSRPPAPAFELGARRSLAELAAQPEESAHEPEPPEEAAPVDLVGTELALDCEAAASSEPPVPERITVPAVPRPGASDAGAEPADDDEPAPETPRDAGWLRAVMAAASEPLEEEEPAQKEEPAEDDALEGSPQEPERVDEADDAFRLEQESFPPVVEDREEQEPEPLSEEQLRRRASLRRMVAAAVVVAGALTVGLATKAVLRPEPAYAQRQAIAAAARLGPSAIDQAREKRAHLAREQKRAEEQERAEPPADDRSYEELSRETVRLLSARKFEEAAALAQRLVDLEPTSAFGYRCLGSALQDLGRTKEAREIYSACATNAKQGEVFECSALGGVAGKK